MAPKKVGGEPEDIFTTLEPKAPAVKSPYATPGPVAAPSAAGKVIAFIVVLLVLVGIGGFAFWYFVVRTPEMELEPIPTLQPLPIIEPTPEPAVMEPKEEEAMMEPKATGTEMMEEPILPPPITTPPPGVTLPPPTPVDGTPTTSETTTTQPVPEKDTDGDGLSDKREQELGIDPAKPDTDDDGLTDREEVEVYATNPLNPDTDGDTFPDGREVQNGFDPRGPGKCANPGCKP